MLRTILLTTPIADMGSFIDAGNNKMMADVGDNNNDSGKIENLLRTKTIKKSDITKVKIIKKSYQNGFSYPQNFNDQISFKSAQNWSISPHSLFSLKRYIA